MTRLDELLTQLWKARRGRSRTAVAELVGVSHVSLFRWETGKAVPDVYSASRWFRALDLAVPDDVAEVFRPPMELQPHGTDARYQWHRRRGTRCGPCWAAHSARKSVARRSGRVA